ncbi:MAG: 1-acyl-sn-glycerol-3-phosphate acyltransferase, partial [Armatimonadetes bacterium]|nr:1-acyl-sn-glycerol-3-phosphate acyltransferase [Armatimonadota bacterium]
MLTDFHPHRFSPTTWRMMNLAYPLALRFNDHVTRIEMSDADWEKLRDLRGRPALLLPNHPSVTEPTVIAGLSRQVNDPFRYVATHEIFQGWKGALIRRMGTFSIRRGYPDFRSLRMCEHALLRENCKMVMFPEGETHMQNDTVIPCHRGAIHVAFRCLSRLEAQNQPLTMALPIIPLVVRYRYVSDPAPAIHAALTRLESAMGLPTDPTQRLWHRARAAGIRVLEGVEREYNLHPATQTTVNERIAAAMDYVAARIVTLTNVTPPTESVLSLRMRTLYNRVFEYRATLVDGVTPYEKRLHERRLVAV